MSPKSCKNISINSLWKFEIATMFWMKSENFHFKYKLWLKILEIFSVGVYYTEVYHDGGKFTKSVYN